MRDRIKTLYSRLTGTVLGSEEPSYLIIVGLLADGHVLIQGAPGIGKTTLAETLANSIDGTFNRVQFTPDLLPADLVGYSMFHQGRGEFEFIPGPVFANVLLADEINRTSPRIQSALLECMNERQVSIDGVTRKLAPPFMVIATQNNLYASGTFPLPEPQLDRFLISTTMVLPDRATQAKILQLHASGRGDGEANGGAIFHADELPAVQQAVREIPVSENVCEYIASLCEAARRQRGLFQSVSARASIALMRAAQAAAYLEGQSAVYPDDVKRIAGAVLGHRLTGGDVAGGGGASPEAVIEEILNSTPVP
jgi:MoxR-like ATPase